MARLSSITITGNEAANIADCLDSVSFCDEKVVVDGGSTDDTIAIAERHGATVYRHPWPNSHGKQKGIALSHATGEWVLLIDADERVSPELAKEILAAVATGDADGYEMPRLSMFCGRWMRHSGWYPDYVLRLFRRGKGRFSDHQLHTRVICDGKVARLKTPLTHYTMRRINDAVSKMMDSYSTVGAKDLLASGRKVSFSDGITHGIWTFIRGYFLQRGFLDGREGFVLAVINAEYTYYRYMKAWYEQEGRGG